MATLTTTRMGNTTTVIAATALSGLVSFYWYLDGAYLGETQSSSGASERTFTLQQSDQSVLTVLDTTDPTFDPIANAPAGYPARRTLFWVRSTDPNIATYQIDQQASGGAWVTQGYMQDVAGEWTFEVITQRLTDLTEYAWRVVPLDAAGNAGTPIALSEEMIVRTPDAPDFAINWTGSAVEYVSA